MPLTVTSISSVSVRVLPTARSFSQSQPRLGHSYQRVFLLRAFRLLREAPTRPRVILVTVFPNSALNSTLGH